MNDTPHSDAAYQEPPAPAEVPPGARFAQLMDEARRGSQEAAEQVWREYGPYVVYVVRRWLRPQMRSRLDSQDFSQDVWASFFRELPPSETVTSPDDLIRWLAKMAKNKVLHEQRRQFNRRRNAERDESYGVFVDRDEVIDQREPTPSQVFAADVLVGELTSEEPERSSRIVQMRREGMTDAEIAEIEQINTRSVRRIFERLQSIFHRRWSEWRE